MNNADIANTLINGTSQDIGELNDWAVNTVRDYCDTMDYDASRVVFEEMNRIDRDRMNLNTYLICSRVGSYHRLNRKIRRAVWAAITTRRTFRSF